MNTSEFISQYTKPVFTAIKSKYVIYSLSTNDEEKEEDVNDVMNALGSLCQRAGEHLIQNKIDTSEKGFRFHTKSANIPETEYFCLAPHINVGYSPFMVNKDADGKVLGVFVKARQHRFAYCSKTIKKLVQSHYELMFKEDTPTTMRAAKEYIKERLTSGNKDNIPLLEKLSEITFYIYFNNATVLAKSAHRDQDGLAAFFELVRILVAKCIDDGNSIPGSEALLERALGTKLFPTPYSNHSMSVGKAFGAYNLTNMVGFYAEQDDKKDSDPSSIEPTWSAGFSAKDDPSQVITFKNSIGLFLPNVDLDNPPPTTFTMINQFADSKALNIHNLRVIGELPTGRLLKEYVKEHEEASSDELLNEYLDITFTTQSKDGNISFQINDRLEYHKEAIRVFLRDHMAEHSSSNKELEKLMLSRNGDLLEVLHDAGELFVTIYLESNPLSEEFGKENTLDKALKAS